MNPKTWLIALSLIFPFATDAAQDPPYPVRPIRQIILKLNSEIARFLKDPGVTQKLAVQGFVAVADSPQEFARYIQSELSW